jgi:hypothetical protein
MISYYDGPDIEELVLGALRASGRLLDPLDPDDLAGLDEFHALGRAGTLALADLADVRPGELVVDVGAGIGGPAGSSPATTGLPSPRLSPRDGSHRSLER